VDHCILIVACVGLVASCWIESEHIGFSKSQVGVHPSLNFKFPSSHLSLLTISSSALLYVLFQQYSQDRFISADEDSVDVFPIEITSLAIV